MSLELNTQDLQCLQTIDLKIQTLKQQILEIENENAVQFDSNDLVASKPKINYKINENKFDYETIHRLEQE